jgi:small conductance mechanosensitive channel
MVITKILFSFTENMSYLNSALKQVLSWISYNLGNILFLIFIGLVTVLVAQSVNRLMEIYLKRMNAKLGMDISTLWMFRHFTVATIYLIGFIIIIFSIPSLQNISIALFTGAGVVSIIIGLAAQSTLSNIISGISLIIFQPFRVGGRLDIMNEYGKVADLNLRHTVILTWDNRRLIIPNSKISSEAIINWTIEDPAIIWSINVGISYDSDIDKAREVMIEEARKHPNVMPLHKVEYSLSTPSLIEPDLHKIGIFEKSTLHPVDPDFKERGGIKVRITDLNDFSINLRLQVWFKDRSIAHSSGCEIREAIIKRFFKEGIEIPYPYRTIIYKTDIENKKKN